LEKQVRLAPSIAVIWLLSAAVVSAAPNKEMEKASTDPTKMICKTVPPPIGSRISLRHVCKTKAKWEQLERHEQEEIHREYHPRDFGKVRA
jgi:hypothetical protein